MIVSTEAKRHEGASKEALAAAEAGGRTVETDIPARLDRLGWGRFHTLVVAALGITWILDGLEVTLAGSLSGALKNSPTLTCTGSGFPVGCMCSCTTMSLPDSRRHAASSGEGRGR